MNDRARGAGSDDLPPWLQVSLASPPPGEALLLVDALRGLGARSVEREGGRVVALFPPHDDPDTLAADVRLAARASTSLADPEVAWSPTGPPDRAERWAADHPARRVSDRIVVVVNRASDARGEPDENPDEDPDEEPDTRAGVRPRPEDRVIRLEPSVAFGTAEHPTTRSCLRMLDALVAPGARVLDVGAGSAVLSIAAVLLGAGRALALEADPVSCAAARRNVARNQLADRVRVEEVAVVPGSLRGRGRFDGIVANLQAGILAPLMDDMARTLARDGWLVVSGIVPSEREWVLGAAERAGLGLVADEVDEGWWTARLAR